MTNQRNWGTFLRFLVAGGINTLFGLSAYSLFIVLHAKPWLALLLATILAILFNFLTVSAYAFKDLVVGRLPKFFAGYAIVYFLNLVGLQLIGIWVDNSIIAQIILTPFMTFFSYMGMSRFIFKS